MIMKLTMDRDTDVDTDTGMDTDMDTERYAKFSHTKNRGISRNFVKFHDTESRIIPRNFVQFRIEYGIHGSTKNIRNSVSAEFRKHPISQ